MLPVIILFLPGIGQDIGVCVRHRITTNDRLHMRLISHRDQNTRVLRIPGADNFRELGGYPARDGRRVKRGLLFRSGHLADLTSGGQKKLLDLDLLAVIDFRSEKESERKPDRLPAGLHPIQLPILDAVEEGIALEIKQRIKSRDFGSFSCEDYILPAYEQYATSFSSVFKGFFRVVVEAAGSPILWHCAAGKDRTGFAAAVLLRLLGVEWEIIYQDYLLSNQLSSPYTWEMIPIIVAGGWDAYQKLKPLLKVKSSWLSAAFTAVDGYWGNFQAYLENGLELTTREISSIQDRLLQ
jgi:protein-tyrosine phosphatase